MDGEEIEIGVEQSVAVAEKPPGETSKPLVTSTESPQPDQKIPAEAVPNSQPSASRIAETLVEQSREYNLDTEICFRDKLEFLDENKGEADTYNWKEMYRNRDLNSLAKLYEQARSSGDQELSEQSLRILLQLAREDWESSNVFNAPEIKKDSPTPESVATLMSSVGINKADQEEFSKRFFGRLVSLGEGYKILNILLENPNLYQMSLHPDSYPADQQGTFYDVLGRVSSSDKYHENGKMLAGLFENKNTSARDLMHLLESTKRMPDERDLRYSTYYQELADKKISLIPGLDAHLQWANITPERRKQFLREERPVDIEEILSGRRSTTPREMSNSISLRELNEAYLLMLARNIHKHVVEDSRDPQIKEAADNRNRQLSKRDNPLIADTLIHCCRAYRLPATLYNGNRAGDMRAEALTGDDTPNAADFWAVLPEDMEELDKLKATSEQNQTTDFSRLFEITGAKRMSPSINNPEGISLLYDRASDNAFMKNMETPEHSNHKTILVGLPSTEISGVVVYDKNLEIVQKVTQEILSNGFYIPIYDVEGKLILTPEQYDHLKEESINQP